MNKLRTEISLYAMTYFRISFPDNVEIGARFEKLVEAIRNAPQKSGGFDLLAARR